MAASLAKSSASANSDMDPARRPATISTANMMALITKATHRAWRKRGLTAPVAVQV